MSGITPAQYEAFRAQMKDQTGVAIEANKTGVEDYVKGFNGISENEKREIASTFDSTLDIALQADLAKVMKECGINRYADLVNNPKAAARLKELGITVQALDSKGNAKKAVHGDRNWLISRVDKEGNVIKDGKGALAQFKMKDFNSDSYIQNVELYVNDLLKVAGYDCVSSLDLPQSELANLANLKGVSSPRIALGEQSNGISSEALAAANAAREQQFMQKMLEQMIIGQIQTEQMTEQDGEKVEAQAEKTEEVEKEPEEEVSKTEVSRVRYEELVEELIEQSRDRNGTPSVSRAYAEAKIAEEYIV